MQVRRWQWMGTPDYPAWVQARFSVGENDTLWVRGERSAGDFILQKGQWIVHDGRVVRPSHNGMVAAVAA